MTNSDDLHSNAPRRVGSALRLLRHLAFVALVGVVAYALAVLSLGLANRGGWLGALGWAAFGAVIAAGAMLVRRTCCLRRMRIAA
jgi:hypothetical protein